jgi:hydrogenase-4 component B
MIPQHPETFVLMAMGLCLAGAAVAWGCSGSRRVAGWVTFAVTVGSAVLVTVGIVRLVVGGPGDGATYFPLERFGFALRLHVDGLSAVFLGLAAVVAVPAALYSIDYLDHYRGESVRRYYPQFLIFLAAMYGLVSTSDMMWFFFIFWQLMTLPGYALIRFERQRAESRRAANKYLWMMQIACVLTMIGAGLLAAGGLATVPGGSGLRYDFETVSARMPELLGRYPGLVAVAFGLFLVGFGIKMGMWPFGVIWLPDAHPAAPSPISALLSGVMIKTGVYGLMRYFLWLVPAGGLPAFPTAGWGVVVVVLGTVTLFLGTFQALRQEQTKRLLAFHSIGQVGYILLGIGVALVLLDRGDSARALAAVAVFAALFHTVNHGLFKALLFLNAGAMLYRTGTQDLNRLGGLLRWMPVTGVTALVAALAISGVPPLNGFASKWTLYVASIRGAEFSGWLVLCALIAILTSALTLASFVKFFGASMLSPSSELVEAQRGGRASVEVGLGLLIPQVFLALLCVGLGLWPALGWKVGGWVLSASPHGFGPLLAVSFPGIDEPLAGLAAPASAAVMVPVVVLSGVGLMALAGFLWSRAGGVDRRVVDRWQCGYVTSRQVPRFTAHHFYSVLKPRRSPAGRTSEVNRGSSASGSASSGSEGRST